MSASAEHAKGVAVGVVAVLALWVCTAACGSQGDGDDDGMGPEETGIIEVTVATTGLMLPSGYTVTLDNAESQPIDANGSVTFQNVPLGTHEVELTDIPANCTVAGDNPRFPTVTSSGSSPASFDVTCHSPFRDGSRL